ncbi:DNA polymerase alpha/epsilon subunit B-domain-containing protein [Chiua virens]|nr:DNA polymerase alpha/epsilon subunit B-domain-containing protein [Chiua virens]
MESLESRRSQVAEYFSEAVADDDTLVQECMTMCKMYNLTVENLSYKWQALSYSNTNSLAIFSHKSIPDLKARLQQELDRQNAAKQEFPSRGSAGLFGRGPGRGVITRGRAGRTLDTGLKRGAILPSMIKQEAPRFSGIKVVFQGPKSDEQSRKMKVRYSPTVLLEASLRHGGLVLDDRIDEFAELVQRHYHVDEFADPNAATEEVTTVVGRMVHDAEVSGSGAKFNESSLVLESSRMMGSGVRIPIHLAPEFKVRGGIKGVGGISFFPGAIVALRGRNGGGGFFLAEEALSLPPAKISPSPPTASDTSFSMCIACGPFSSDSDLEYKPWASLLEKVKASKPAVILLLGPFVDVTNSRIKDGDTDETPQQLFERQFTEKFQDVFLHSPGSQILLVPSINDMISDHVVFPQCELPPGLSMDIVTHPPTSKSLSLFHQWSSFAVTSVDTLFHLRKEEFFRRAPDVEPLVPTSEPATDGIANLARNIFQQRSFYPIFPPPLDVAHEVNLDVTHSDGTRLMESEDECLPDVLVLPSRLKQFAKVVDSTTVVNPSSLSKGSYAILSYDGQGSGLAKDRITADISKI